VPKSCLAYTTAGESRPVHLELRYDVVEGDAGARYEWGEPYSLTYWKTASFYYTRQDYNINLFATDDLDGSGYGKDGWSYYKGNILNARFDYRSVRRAMDSDVNPRGGRTVELRAARTWAGLNPTGQRDIETFQPTFEDNSFNEIEGDWREHLALPWGRHTLELRARAGFIDDTAVDDFFFTPGRNPGSRLPTSRLRAQLGIGAVTAASRSSGV
jgi:hypothetical protein